jgi:hypothetical protein
MNRRVRNRTPGGVGGGRRKAPSYPILVRFSEPIELGNVRANGVRLLAVSCGRCRRETVLAASRWRDDAPVAALG